MVRRVTAALLLVNLILLAWLVLADTTGRDEREPGRLQQQVQPDSVQLLPAQAAADAKQAPDTAASSGAAQARQDGASAIAGGSVTVSSAAAVTAALAAGGLMSPAASAVPAGMGASTAAGGRGAVTGAVTALNAVCLEAGPFDAQALPAAEAALAELPRGTWRRQLLQPPPAYLVYLGRFSDPRTAQRRLQELRQRGIQAELAHDLPALEPGLVLSRHAQSAQAEAALAALQAQRNAPSQARVVSTGEAAAVMLRVEHPTDEVRNQLAGLEPTPALRGGFRGCRKMQG